MKPYADIAELIETLEAEIQLFTNQISTLKEEPKSFNEQVIRVVREKQKTLSDH